MLASHCQRTHWLYPSPPNETLPSTASSNTLAKVPAINGENENAHKTKAAADPVVKTSSANKYGPFASVESSILTSLNEILSETRPEDLTSNNATSTPIAGALSMALNYINRLTLALSPNLTSTNKESLSALGAGSPQLPLNSRILVVSTSGDLANQYVSLMNAMFAAQDARAPIDILKLAGDSVLLQQASYTTGGVFINPYGLPNAAESTASDEPSLDKATEKSKEKKKGNQQFSLLPYLMQALLPDAAARQHLYSPTNPDVDFRAACFCHRKVVDIGYVCSICLSIFCTSDLPDGGTCLTCGTRLQLGGVGEGLVTGDMGKKKEKKKKKNKDGKESGIGSLAT